jgi:polysaccharide biosynthesis transport protein
MSRIAPNEPSFQLPAAADHSWATDEPGLWSVVQRHLVLVVVCALSATVAAMFLTARLTRVFEATASVRIDEQSSRPAALEGLGISGTNMLATELEMLRSRQLAQEVSDSIAFRLRVSRPLNATRSSLISEVRVARDAAPGARRLVRTSESSFAFVGPNGETLVRAIPAGGHVDHEGVAFTLAPTASSESEIELQVLSNEVALDSLGGAIDISRRNREADVVDVSVRDADPALARDVANTLVRRFIQGRENVKQLEARSAVEFLRGQISRVAAQLSDAERRLRDFREDQSIVSLPDEASSGVTRRAELQAQRNAMEAERQALDRVLHAPRADAGGEAATYRELLAFPTLLRSGIASDVLSALNAAEERRAELLTRRTNQDPDVVLVNSRITQLQSGIRALVGTYVSGLTDQVSALDALLAQSDAKLRAIPGKEIRLGMLERNAKGSEAVYSMLLSRLKEAEIAAASSDQSVRMVDAAELPRFPISPRPVVNLTLALFIGTLLGIAGAFVLEHGDRSLHTRRELLAATGVPVLGIVPRLELGRGVPRTLSAFAARLGSKAVAPAGSAALTRSGGTRPGGARRTESLFVFTEAVSRLAINLTFLAAEKRPRVLVVTSPVPGDGKTTVATNLALAIARSGRRVLLIDADLRGGRIARALSLTRTPGLSEVLAGTMLGAQVAQELPAVSEGQVALHVLTTGAATSAPARLLASSRAEELIAWARSTYEMVIIDTPPVTSIADATILAPLSDGVVLVARSGATLRDAIAFAMEQLHIVRAPVLGAVLNDVDLRREGAYDSAYEYYGRYTTPVAAVS